jgi:hypothetical protein
VKVVVSRWIGRENGWRGGPKFRGSIKSDISTVNNRNASLNGRVDRIDRLVDGMMGSQGELFFHEVPPTVASAAANRLVEIFSLKCFFTFLTLF